MGVAGKRVRCRADELVGLIGEVVEPARSPTPPAPSDTTTGTVEPELLLLGRTVEEALDLLDNYLDRALAAGREEVRIVHGHGTGRLRDAVRAHLRGHAAVDEFRAGAPREGGNGATVARLRA